MTAKRKDDTGHTTVMLDEVLEILAARDDGIYVDGTFGVGGVSRALLEQADCRVWGIDRDPEAVARGRALAESHPGRFEGRLAGFRSGLCLLEVATREALKLLPPLIKGYLRLGGFVGDGAVVDHEFGTTDVCVVVKTELVTDRYYRHYTRDEPAKA